MQSWADRQLSTLREDYAGCWYVSLSPAKRGCTWHARPAGTPSATVNADSPEGLADTLGTLMCQCPRHAESAGEDSRKKVADA
jgi:hypothetical protein